jgi:hypothetical protein
MASPKPNLYQFPGRVSDGTKLYRIILSKSIWQFYCAVVLKVRSYFFCELKFLLSRIIMLLLMHSPFYITVSFSLYSSPILSVRVNVIPL